MHWNLLLYQLYLYLIKKHHMLFTACYLIFEQKILMFLKLAAGKKEYLGTKSWELQSAFLIFISSWTCFRCVSKYPWLLWRIEILNIDVAKTIGHVWYCEKISRWVWFKSTYHSQWLNKAPTPSLQLTQSFESRKYIWGF